MAIYQRCKVCKKDYPVGQGKRVCCQSKLPSDRYQVKVADPNSGRWKSKVCPSLKVAKKIERQFKVAAVEGTLHSRPDVPPDFPRYLEWAKVNKPGSWKDDLSRWNKHVAPYPHSTPKDVRDILHRVRHLAPATRRQILQLIRKVYNWHIQSGDWHSPNPTRGITLPKFDNKVDNTLPPDQLKLFIDSVESYHNRHMARVVLFALYTGRRFSEIVNLEWDRDITMDHRFITCRHTKNSLTLSFPLSSQARSCIPEHPSSRYIFPSPKGKHYGNTFRKTWGTFKRHLWKQGIMDIRNYRFHDLRHQYASALAGRVDIYILQRLLGHSDIKLTMRYAHLADSRLQDAVEEVSIS